MSSGTRVNPTIFIQDACYLHRYIRSSDISLIVERPERLRAVKVGLAIAIARLESTITSKPVSRPSDDTDDLTAALDKLNLQPYSSSLSATVVHSSATVDLQTDLAVKFVHSQELDYLERMTAWCRQSSDKISSGESEIPLDLPQGDLYMCPESLQAIQGALGTTCEAVDRVLTDPDPSPAFVAIRPPGHHCGEESPMGFCFVNNVAVAAAHAHLKHGIEKIVVFDIDLHHGNGTQAIVWAINEETYRKKLEIEESNGASSAKPGPQIFYDSLHDVLSFPCEDGNVSMIQAASTKIHGAHGQWVENIHLEFYESEPDFYERLYDKKYSEIFARAREFVGKDEDYLVFISCGMDACEHEYESMSRHGSNVPTSFYHRFASEARQFAKRNRIISVLEGGYSDRALISGTLAHVCGLASQEPIGEWWSVENLEKIERATKKGRGGKVPRPQAGSVELWVERAVSLFISLDANSPAPPKASTPVPPSSRTLRERKNGRVSLSPSPSPQKPSKLTADGDKNSGVRKVILKLGPKSDVESSTDESSEDTKQ